MSRIPRPLTAEEGRTHLTVDHEHDFLPVPDAQVLPLHALLHTSSDPRLPTPTHHHDLLGFPS